MATKRIVHTLVVQVRLPDGSETSWRFRAVAGVKTSSEVVAKRKRKVRADVKARASDQGVEILSTEWSVKTQWRAYVVLPDGSPSQPVFDSKTEAEAHEKAVKAAAVVGVDLDLAQEPLSLVVTRWRDGASVDWEAATAAQVDSFLNAHVLPAFGSWPVGRIRHSDVTAWVGRMRRGGLKKATALRVCRLLERILDTSVRDGAIHRNPCSGVERGKVKPSESGLWLERPAVKTLALAMPDRYQVAVLAAHGAALRFQEMAGLRRDRILAPGERRSQGKVVSLVDTDSSWRLRIDSVLVEVKGHVHEKDYPKTEAGVREIPLPSGLAEVLLAHCDRFEVGSGDLVFSSPRGAPLRRGNYSKRILYPASEKALGQRVHTHDLRRSGISQWIADGIRTEVAQVWAGHADLRTTMQVYHSVFPSTAAESVDQLEEANSGVDFGVGWPGVGPGVEDDAAAAL